MTIVALILMIILCLATMSALLYVVISGAIHEAKMQKAVDEWNKDPRHIPLVRE